MPLRCLHQQTGDMPKAQALGEQESMRNYVVVASMLVMAGVGVSLLLIPRSHQAPLPRPTLTPAATLPPSAAADDGGSALIDQATSQFNAEAYGAVIKTMQTLKTSHPDAVDDTLAWMWVKSLMATGANAAALQTARDWMENPTSLAEETRARALADFSDLLSPEQGVMLMDEYLTLLVQSPDLVTAYVTANILAGRPDVAYNIVQRLAAADRTVPALSTLAFELAVAHHDKPLAEKLLPTLDVATLAPETRTTVLAWLKKRGAGWKKILHALETQMNPAAPAEESLNAPMEEPPSAAKPEEKPVPHQAQTPATEEDKALVSYVGNTPKALYEEKIRKQYFPALARVAGADTYETGMQNWVSQTTDVAAILDYALTAKAHGFSRAAGIGFTRVLALDPTNETALHHMKQLPPQKTKKVKKSYKTAASEAP